MSNIDHFEDENPSGELAAARYANHATEAPINPREQRLRPAPAPVPEPVADEATTDVDEGSTDSDEGAIPDPYGVGQAALEANNIPATKVGKPGEVAGDNDYVGSSVDRRQEAFASRSTALRPADWGWRGWCNRTLGMSLSPKNPSPEVNFRLGVETLKEGTPGVPLITVANPKGGENKTGTALTMSATFGTHTGSGVVAWDASSSFGSMAMRAHNGRTDRRSNWGLLKIAKQLCSKDVPHTAIDQFMIRQPTLDEVLPADDSGTSRRQLDWSACEATYAVLRRHRRLIIVDTENNHLAESLQWALVRADQIVIPMTACDDTIQEVEAMLRLAQGDPDIGSEKVSQAIVLLSPLPDAPVTPDRLELVESMLSQFNIPTILHMPFDPAFAGHRSRIVFDDLLPETRSAYVELCAMITSRLNAQALTAGVSMTAAAPPEQYTGQWQAPAPQQGGYGYSGDLAQVAVPQQAGPRGVAAHQYAQNAQQPIDPGAQFTGYSYDTTNMAGTHRR